MRHNKHRATLGVTVEHRKAMLSNMGASLIKHGRIKTTFTKAKALRPFVEKVITKAKKAAAFEKIDGKLDPRALHLRRLALKSIRDEDAITQLFNEKVTEFLKREGGYTRIYKLGPRQNDAANMALIEFVKADDQGYKKSSRRRKASAKPAAAETTPAKEAVPASEETPAAEESAAASAPAPEAVAEAEKPAES